MTPITQRTVATPDGLPVLVHNGTPNSRHLYAPVVADCGADGLDYYDGMGQENADDLRLMLTDEAAAQA